MTALRRLCPALVAVVVCTWATAASADRLDDIKARGTLIWGGDEAGGQPFVYADPNDDSKHIGFEVDLANMIAAELSKQLGREIKAEFKQGDWGTLPLLVNQGAIDIALNGIELLPERARDFRCSRPYYEYGLQLMARDDGVVTSWEDLSKEKAARPIRIGVLGNTAAERYLRDNPDVNVELVAYDGQAEPMEHTAEGRLDATLQDDCIAIHALHEDRFKRLVFVEMPVKPGYYVALIEKNESRLQTAIDQALAEIIRDGRLRQVYDKWSLAGSWQELALRSVADVKEAARPTLWQLATGHFGTLLSASVVTVMLAVISMPLAILIGIGVAVGRMYGPWWIGKPLGLYVEVLRGTPLMLQLYAIFFLLPKIGILVPPFVAAIAGLAINYSAYEAEIYRAGLQAIPRGQMEAALALGMTRAQAIWRIILPQAIRIVIPPVTNDFIALFKDTSVCSVVTVVELTKQYQILALSTGAAMEIAFLTGVLYMLMSYPLSVAAAWNERRLQGSHMPGHH